MPRPTKQAIDYFPLDVSCENDDKLQMIIGEFGMKGEFIFIKLLAYIYKNEGYYCVWDEKTQLKFATGVAYALGGSQVNLIREVVARLIQWEVFDNLVFDSFGILTSRRIQKTWLDATRKRADRHIEPKLWLLTDKNPDKTVNSVPEAEETPEKTEVIHKVKKSKVNKSSCSSRAARQASDQPKRFYNNDHDFLNFTLFTEETETRAEIDLLFQNFCDKVPHPGEITRVYNILTESDLPAPDTWELIVQAFKEFPLAAEAKRNSQYLCSKISGRIGDKCKKQRERQVKQQKASEKLNLENIQAEWQEAQKTGDSPYQHFLKEQGLVVEKAE